MIFEMILINVSDSKIWIRELLLTKISERGLLIEGLVDFLSFYDLSQVIKA